MNYCPIASKTLIFLFLKNAHLYRLCRKPFLVREQWQQRQLIFFLGLRQKWSCKKPASAAIFTAWSRWNEHRRWPRRQQPTAHTFHRFQIQTQNTNTRLGWRLHKLFKNYSGKTNAHWSPTEQVNRYFFKHSRVYIFFDWKSSIANSVGGSWQCHPKNQ